MPIMMNMVFFPVCCVQDQEEWYFRTDLEGRLQEAAKTLELEKIHPVNEGDNEFNMKMRGAIRKRGCKTKKSSNPSYSKSPSKAPSPVLPTVYPSSAPSELGFVLSDCASYSFLWHRDLSQSCRESEEYPSTYIDCACKDAQERINTGEIKKYGKHHQCPYDCAVCELCLSTMVDCP